MKKGFYVGEIRYLRYKMRCVSRFLPSDCLPTERPLRSKALAGASSTFGSRIRAIEVFDVSPVLDESTALVVSAGLVVSATLDVSGVFVVSATFVESVVFEESLVLVVSVVFVVSGVLEVSGAAASSTSCQMKDSSRSTFRFCCTCVPTACR